MKYQDNSTLKEYWEKIKQSSKSVDIVSYPSFYNTYVNPKNIIIYLENGIFRISNVIMGHKAELHGYVFGHRIFDEIEKFKLQVEEIASRYSLHRIECVVDEGNKGLQRLLSRVNFKSEGIRENGVFLNGLCVRGIGFVYTR